MNSLQYQHSGSEDDDAEEDEDDDEAAYSKFAAGGSAWSRRKVGDRPVAGGGLRLGCIG